MINNVGDIEREIQREENNIKTLKTFKDMHKITVLMGIIGLTLLTIIGLKTFNSILALSMCFCSCAVYNQVLEWIEKNNEIVKAQNRINDLNNLLKIIKEDQEG